MLRFVSRLGNFALFALFAFLFASVLAIPPLPVEAQAEGAAPFLWEVRAGAQPSYLFGTIHLGVSLDEALPAPHRAKLHGARLVMSEMDAASSNLDPQAMMAASLLPGGQSLRSMMPEATWEALQRELGMGMPAMVLDRMRPWVPVTVVAQQRISTMLGGDVPEPMDAALIAAARARRQRVAFLESYGEQIAIMNSVPSRYFVRELREMLEHPEESNRELRRMLGAYRRGDAPAMTRLVFDPDDVASMPEYYERLFRRRNRAWMSRLGREFRGSGGTFVAVGLGHLLGSDGLLALLRAQGFTVSRVATP